MVQRKGHSDAGRDRRPRSARNGGGSPDTGGHAGGTPWLYGLHAVSAAIANPARHCTRLLATENAAKNIRSAEPSISPEIVDRRAIEALLPPGAVHQGLALLAVPLPERHLTDLTVHAEKYGRTVAVALDQVTDPQNVGAVLRSAAAFGAAGLIVTDRHAPDATGALAKAASGALETVPLIRPPNLSRALDSLKSDGFWVVGLDMDAPETIDRVKLPERCILALGAEGPGLRRLTREACDLTVRIPMTAGMESLNVSATAAVALYEWARQGAA